ncbi:Hypothetical predicted protein [Xyrichtys novacula]|uniref:Uncharacterized protein n=1 Tax=Xyrichtys novacula TaxID=13765 RepID=A0AAV1F2X1_XYRNO|nr:Hypothetical predicted protein [Xyrichtys novacula]
MKLQLHDSDENLYDELFQVNHPSPGDQESDHTQAPRQSHLHSVVSIPQPRRSHSRSPNIISMTPDRLSASSPPRRSADHRSYNYSNLLRSPLRYSHCSATGNSTRCSEASPRRQTPPK